MSLDTRNPVTAPITVTGKRSVCPPRNPSNREIVKGRGRTAEAGVDVLDIVGQYNAIHHIPQLPSVDKCG